MVMLVVCCSEMNEWIEYMTFDGVPMADLRAKNGQEKPWKVKYFGVGMRTPGLWW